MLLFQNNRNLVWNEYKTWIPVISKLLESLYGKNIISIINKNVIKPNYFDKSWMTFSNRLNDSTYFDLLNIVLNEIENYYSSFCVYHACRCQNVKNYYKNGIIKSDISELDNLLIEILIPTVKITVVNRIISYLHTIYDDEDKKVFVYIDKNHLVEFCTNHLLFGSEYILTGILLLEKFNIKSSEILKVITGNRNAKSTIFECHIPISIIDKDDLLMISEILLIETIKYMGNNIIPKSRRTSLKLNTNILSEWISNNTDLEVNYDEDKIVSNWLNPDTIPNLGKHM